MTFIPVAALPLLAGIASENIEHMAALADAGQQGYHWEKENGQKTAFLSVPPKQRRISSRNLF